MLCFCKNLIKKSIERNENIAEEQIPRTNGINSPKLNEPIAPFNSTMPERVIAGIPSKKDNFAADCLSQPVIKAVVIVIPDLETPGIKASDWDNPIKRPSKIFISSSVLERFPNCSAKSISKDMRIDTNAIEGIDLTIDTS